MLSYDRSRGGGVCVYVQSVSTETIAPVPRNWCEIFLNHRYAHRFFTLTLLFKVARLEPISHLSGVNTQFEEKIARFVRNLKFGLSDGPCTSLSETDRPTLQEVGQNGRRKWQSVGASRGL